jgi:hypothetical protein
MKLNNKLKPLLVDQNVIGEYMKQKYQVQSPEIVPKEPGQIQKLLTRIMYNVLNFLYNYFFIIAILFAIIFYLYRRYRWYQDLKKVKDNQKEKESNEMKKYFDNILSEENKKPDLIQKIINPINSVLKKPENISNKMNIVVGNNNSYINHLKNSYEINSQNEIKGYNAPSKKLGDANPLLPSNINNQVMTTKIGMSSRNGFTKIHRPDIQTKTVRFAADEFDSFGRNSINPKTGEILAFNENSNYSMF